MAREHFLTSFLATNYLALMIDDPQGGNNGSNAPEENGEEKPQDAGASARGMSDEM